jgi:adenylate cyclase
MSSTGASATTTRLRHYVADDSIFVDDDYLIKGVAGAILWKLVGDYARAGRTDFTNRELRLDPQIRLPDLFDNLEARLILLQRRLAERSDAVRIEKTGRGRFRLCVQRPMELQEISAGARA